MSPTHVFIQRGFIRERNSTCSHLECAAGQPASAGAVGVNGFAPFTSHPTRRGIWTADPLPHTYTNHPHRHAKCALLRMKLCKGEEVSNVSAKIAANVLFSAISWKLTSQEGLRRPFSHTPAAAFTSRVNHTALWQDDRWDRAVLYTQKTSGWAHGRRFPQHVGENKNPGAAWSRPAGRVEATSRRTPSSSGLCFIESFFFLPSLFLSPLSSCTLLAQWSLSCECAWWRAKKRPFDPAAPCCSSVTRHYLDEPGMQNIKNTTAN